MPSMCRRTRTGLRNKEMTPNCQAFSLRQGAALGLCEGQPDGAHQVEFGLEELRVALGQRQQRLLGQKRGLAIELLPNVVQSEVGVTGQGFYLLRGGLEFSEGTVPLERMDDLLGRHGCCASAIRG